MTPRPHSSPGYLRLSLGSRVWAVLVLGISTASLGETSDVMMLAGLALLWGFVSVTEQLDRLSVAVMTFEAAFVGSLAVFALDARPPMLLALAIPPFTGGLRRGPRGLGNVLAVELVVVVGLVLGVHGGLTVDEASTVLTYVLTGVGLGLIASYVHYAVINKPLDPLAPYREAQVHIRGLLDLSGDLRSGLDPLTLGSRIAVEVRNAVPVEAVSVYIPRGDSITPLVAGAVSSSVDKTLLEPLGQRAWISGTVVVDEERFALPLRTDAGPVAVVAGMLAVGRDISHLGIDTRLDALGRSLLAHAVQLDTALLFGRLRDAATADERRRLARDLHDGVAQDIASLGYLVDGLAAAPASPGQAETLRRLRERVTDVVAQVRLSVQTLRTDSESAESLGAAISGLARHLSDSSGIPIRVSADERTTRLRPEVESELLRITQEAMTNAVRHASPGLIEVTCRVAAPFAEITVRDDGAGLGQPRPDSYGLMIMKERADLIDADFEISTADPRGTLVTVRVPSRHQSASRSVEDRQDKVSL